MQKCRRFISAFLLSTLHTAICHYLINHTKQSIPKNFINKTLLIQQCFLKVGLCKTKIQINNFGSNIMSCRQNYKASMPSSLILKLVT